MRGAEQKYHMPDTRRKISNVYLFLKWATYTLFALTEVGEKSHAFM